MENEALNNQWWEKNKSKINGVIKLSDSKNENTTYEQEINEVLSQEPLSGEFKLTFTLSDLMGKQFPPVSWLVQRLIPAQGMVAISGTPGSYKSWLTEHLAICLSSGEPFLDNFETTQGAVLFIDKENSPSLIQHRFKLLGADPQSQIHFLNCEFYIEDEDLISEVCNFIHSHDVKLVVIDSLIRVYKGKDENSANHMAEVFSRLKKFQESGAAILFTHHHRKQSILGRNVASESMRGSSDILAAVDSHLAVEVAGEEIKIVQTKLRQELSAKPFKVRLESDVASVRFVFAGELEEDKEKVEQAMEEILAVMEEGEVSRQDLIERFKGVYGSKTIDIALKSLNPEDVLLRKGERGKKFYRLVKYEPENLFGSVSQNGDTYIGGETAKLE